jgi:KaiC/GvpD/RAD55 family RecA-like ATPase
MSAVTVALECAERGWYVFPCKEAKYGDDHKAPWTKNGHLDATTDPAQIREWWTRKPEALIGVDCGRSHIIVADVDSADGHGGPDGYETWSELKASAPEVEDTMLVETVSGGLHAYYRANGHKVQCDNTGKRLGQGIHVKAQGGYVIAAGSDGYEYVDGHGPEALAELPAFLGEKLAYAHTSQPAQAEALTIATGQRNAALTSLAGTMRKRGMGEEAILAALLAENKTRCETPLPESEVSVIAKSVSRYAPAEEPALTLPDERPHEQAWSATSDEALYAFTKDLDRRKNGEIVGLPWPPEWPGLSRYVGPLEPGSLTVIAARPSIGKSLFALQLQRWLCSKGHRVLFVSRELTKVRLIRRQVTSFGADLKRLQSGRLVENDVKAFDNYMAQSKGWKVRYDDHSQTVADIGKEAALTKPDIIIIDYLQRLAYDTEKEYAAITRIVNELQDLTLSTNVPVVCLSQLARPLKGNEWKQPNMSDIRGSGAVEERAANIILLHRIWDTTLEEKYGKQVKVAQKQTDDGLFLISKCADGEAGGYCRVLFNGARMSCQEKL